MISANAINPSAEPALTRARTRRYGALAVATLAHGLVFVVIARLTPQKGPPGPTPPILVELVRPDPPVLPPPPPSPSRVAGGGAPAASSRVHVVPEPVDVPDELPAPVEQAPEPAPEVGIAPVDQPDPGLGQGGEGTGTGTGVGAGEGPGSGGGTPPRFVAGPTQDQRMAVFPRAALRARRSGHVELACRIRLDERLEGCRVVQETPPGEGFGQAGIAASAFFRFRPPTEGGRPVAGREITVGVDFGPQPPAR